MNRPGLERDTVPFRGRVEGASIFAKEVHVLLSAIKSAAQRLSNLSAIQSFECLLILSLLVVLKLDVGRYVPDSRTTLR